MNELALFAGAGGGLLGTRLLGFRPVCAVELNSYRREVLLRRQEEGHLEPFPVWDDIRTFDPRPWYGKVDIITAGFPCQPFSVAGKQQGENDPRNMWPETIRVIRQVRPRFCLLENVPGLKAKEYFGQILADLAKSGYCVRWDCIPAANCGAPHQRDRLWILAYPSEERLERIYKTIGGINLQPTSKNIPRNKWSPTPRVCRGGDGLAHKVDRLGALGDGQVPAVVVRAWNILTSSVNL